MSGEEVVPKSYPPLRLSLHSPTVRCAAVIGLGGTGSYLLDFIVKTPVREIRAFDVDPYHVHNAFRSPGRLDPAELGKSKAEVYRGRYDNFRHGLVVQPKFIEPGALYVSEEFGAAAHLCACGCGAKIRTPLGPTEWSFEEAEEGPTLYPSIGNWQQGCKSHYWIIRGEVRWSHTWTEEQIAAGRRAEQERREEYFEVINRKTQGFFGRFWRWLKSLFGC